MSARVTLVGVDFDALTEAATVATVVDALDEGRGGWVMPVRSLSV